LFDGACTGALALEQLVDSLDLFGKRSKHLCFAHARAIEHPQERHTLEFVVNPERVVEIKAYGADRYFGAGP
jgi:hypothetical protein